MSLRHSTTDGAEVVVEVGGHGVLQSTGGPGAASAATVPEITQNVLDLN